MNASSPSASGRLVSLDALRGAIMILMAVDHAAFFVAKVHPGEFWGVGLPDYPGGVAFLTRFVTHLCAPGFFFLMGAGMALLAASRSASGWGPGRIRRHYLVRGALLIGLQLVVENPAWFAGFMTARVPVDNFGVSGAPGVGGPPLFLFGVLWALGASMILGSFLLRLRPVFLVVVAVAVAVACQALLPGADLAATPYALWQRLLLIPGATGSSFVIYAVLPWIPAALLGMAFGRALQEGTLDVRRAAFAGSALLLAVFFALRLAGGFGNVYPPGDGWIGFLAVTKYPPSLAFTTLTLGIDLLLLGLLAGAGSGLERWGRPLLVFGRAALFFYFAHIYLYLALGQLFPRGTGYPGLYAMWAVGLLLLYPATLGYGRFKARKGKDSLWRFF